MSPFLTTLLIASVVLCIAKSECEFDYDKSSECDQPQFVNNGGNVSVKEGNSIQLKCIVKNLGEFVILWRFNQSQVLFAGDLRIHRDDRIEKLPDGIQIKNFTKEYSGDYSCLIYTNPPKELVYRVTLRQTKPPFITGLTKDKIVVKSMESIRFDCNSSNADTTEWRKDGKPFSLNKHLIIEKAKWNDSGIYKCIASNDYGKDERELHITVQYAPEVKVKKELVLVRIGSTAKIECLIKAEPKAMISWYKNMTTNGTTFSTELQQTKSIFEIKNVSKQDFAKYWCVATNPLGVTSSQGIQLLPLKLDLVQRSSAQIKQFSLVLVIFCVIVKYFIK